MKRVLSVMIFSVVAMAADLEIYDVLTSKDDAPLDEAKFQALLERHVIKKEALEGAWENRYLNDMD